MGQHSKASSVTPARTLVLREYRCLSTNDLHLLLMAVEPHIRSAADRYNRRIRDIEELEQKSLITVARLAPSYDPTKSSLKTFAARVVKGHAMTLGRSESRLGKKRVLFSDIATDDDEHENDVCDW